MKKRFSLIAWRIPQGLYSELEEKLTGLGFQWEDHSYNNHDRHFEYPFGELDSPERMEQSGKAQSMPNIE